MSFDDSLYGCLTDSERAAGCGPHLWEDEYDDRYDEEYDEEYERKAKIKLKEEMDAKEKAKIKLKEEMDAKEKAKIKLKEEMDAKEKTKEEIAWQANVFQMRTETKKSKEKSEIIKLIAGLNENNQIKNITIRKLTSDNLDYMIYTYSKIESLPYHYVYVAKQNDGIAILIKGFLKSNAKIVLTAEVIKNINTLCYEIYTNLNLDIVYDRVYKIQKFLHDIVDAHNGEDAHLKLCATTMKHILSASRLHLNLQDIKKLDANNLYYLIEQSDLASKIEAKHPARTLSSSGIIYTNYKRSRDMKTLFNFGYFNIVSKIYDVMHLDSNISTNEFKKKIINIYSDKRYCK
jgi:hypothetical protein